MSDNCVVACSRRRVASRRDHNRVFGMNPCGRSPGMEAVLASDRVVLRIEINESQHGYGYFWRYTTADGTTRGADERRD